MLMMLSLAIENVGVLNPEKNEIVNDNISEENSTENVLDRKQADIRKVWKTNIKAGNQYCVDANTQEVIHIKDIFEEENGYKN